MNVSACGFVASGQIECAGCGKPIETGCHDKASIDKRGSVHALCQREQATRLYDPSVRVGETRERLTQLKSRIQLGSLDADILRAVLLTLIDEVMR